MKKFLVVSSLIALAAVAGLYKAAWKLATLAVAAFPVWATPWLIYETQVERWAYGTLWWLIPGTVASCVIWVQRVDLSAVQDLQRQHQDELNKLRQYVQQAYGNAVR